MFPSAVSVEQMKNFEGIYKGRKDSMELFMNTKIAIGKVSSLNNSNVRFQS